MTTQGRKVLGITLGDVGGIGPEVVLAAAHKGSWPNDVRLVLVGHAGIVRAVAEELRIRVPPSWETLGPSSGSSVADALRTGGARVVVWEPRAMPGLARRPGHSSESAAKAAVEWVRVAAQACLDGVLDGMVTGPICKETLRAAGVDLPGHTELLAQLTGSADYAMMLIGGPLRVVLVTRHLPLARVPAAVTREEIVRTVKLADRALPWLGLENRRIGVCALNPHAGDGGLLGGEEAQVIRPAIEELVRAGLQIEGPVPADVIFYRALQDSYGAVVAMYHDQGLAPLKMLAFDIGVNLTLGLPIVRTSPDHGTAFDIAGKRLANPDSMIEAVRLALRLAEQGNPWAAARPGSRGTAAP